MRRKVQRPSGRERFRCGRNYPHLDPAAVRERDGVFACDGCSQLQGAVFLRQHGVVRKRYVLAFPLHADGMHRRGRAAEDDEKRLVGSECQRDSGSTVGRCVKQICASDGAGDRIKDFRLPLGNSKLDAGGNFLRAAIADEVDVRVSQAPVDEIDGRRSCIQIWKDIRRAERATGLRFAEECATTDSRTLVCRRIASAPEVRGKLLVVRRFCCGTIPCGRSGRSPTTTPPAWR